jgi:hypothetical protein
VSQFIPWIQGAIPGFVYVSAFFFVIQFFAGKKNLKYDGVVSGYLPYIAIIVVFFSYVVGLSSYLISEKIIYCIYDKYTPHITKLIELQKNIPEKVYLSYRNTYEDLIMLRHLSASTLILGISLYNWFRKSEYPKFKWLSLNTCILFTAFFVLAYCAQRELLIELRTSISAP